MSKNESIDSKLTENTISKDVRILSIKLMVIGVSTSSIGFQMAKSRNDNLYSVFLTLGVLLIITGLNIKKGSKWSWWFSSIILSTFCFVIIYKIAKETGSFNPFILYFFWIVYLINKQSVIEHCDLAHIPSNKRTILSAGISLILWSAWVIR